LIAFKLRLGDEIGTELTMRISRTHTVVEIHRVINFPPRTTGLPSVDLSGNCQKESEKKRTHGEKQII